MTDEPQELEQHSEPESGDSPQAIEKLSPRLPKLPECIIIFISGPVASGKSWLIQQLVNKMERVLINDVTAEYSGDNYTHIWSNPKELAEFLKEHPHAFRIAYHPNSAYIEDEFHWMFSAIWQLEQPRWFVIEECHNVCDANSIHSDMENLLRYARHNLLGVIGSSQRIADVHKLLTSSARMVVLFHTTEFRDLQAIRERFGDAAMHAVENLRPCIYNDATKDVEQHPECLIYIRGRGFAVVELGFKVKSDTQESTEQWEELSQEIPPKQDRQSSPQDSSNPEPSLKELTSGASQPTTTEKP